MKLYNTLTRKVEPLTPVADNLVRLYTCGPTVYDHAHIGNLSSYIFADTLRRALQLSGYAVKHVMNYTDVDDKTIRRSHEMYASEEPRAALTKLTNKYIELFRDDMQKIGNQLEPITFVRATNPRVIDAMKQLIIELHKTGFAYLADDGVYFSIEAYRKSGKQYGQLLEITAQNTSAARIQNDEYDKESVHDFAIWKKQKEGEPAWDFTLDGHDMTGRPGWHIECSVMSRQELGQPFDIHTGGVDLIFPHHENEIAQSTALEDNPVMAQVFAHNEHLLVDGKKMSKSLNNFYTLEDVVKKGYDPLAFRLLVLQSHYRNQAHFSWENLDTAQNLLKELREMADLLWQIGTDTHLREGALLSNAKKEITSALQNDLDTHHALMHLVKVKKQWLGILTSSQQSFRDFLEFLDEAFGLSLIQTSDISDEQTILLKDRENARRAKDWTRANDLRDKLEKQGLGLRDTAQGTIWYRT